MTAAALLLVAAIAQAAQAPPRDLPPAVASAPAAQLTGRVITTDNQRLQRAVVRLTSSSLAAPRVLRTDLEGRFTFNKLPPGRFTLRASKPGFLTLEYGQRRPFESGRRLEIRAAEQLRNVDVVLPKAAAISGVVLDDGGDPAAQMWVVAARAGFREGRRQLLPLVTTLTNDIGEFRLAGLAPGDYFVVAKERDMRVGDTSDDRTGFETTYHPGTASPAEAQPIRLALGQEVVNVSLTMLGVRTGTVTGRVVDTAGAPVTGVRVSMAETYASTITAGNIVGAASVNGEGRFRITGARPGRWVLFSSRGTTDNAEVPIEIGGGETQDVTLVLGPGGTLAGRIVDDTGTALAPQVLAETELRLVVPRDRQVRSYSTTRPRTDGAFEWHNVLASAVIRPARLPEGFWLKAIVRGDTDVTDTPLDITHSATVSNLAIVLAGRGATVSGDVLNDGKPEADYTVILFPAERKPPAALDRLVRAERPDHKGSFRITGIPPGEWLAAAVEYVEDGQWLDPAYLDTLRAGAVPMTLAAPSSTSIVLHLNRR